jgi:opacity protein-like surface antigen
MKGKSMNKHFPALLFAGTVALFPVSPVQAQLSHFYVKGDIGGNWTSDTSLKGFFGEPLAPNSKVQFDPGFRLGVTAGYQLTDWFSVEGEMGVMANEIKSVTGASKVNNASFANMPFLINVRFQYPTDSRFTPYLGGGLGGAASVISVDNLTIGQTKIDGSQSAAVFAYQAFGGLRFRLNDRMAVGIEYRYFATTDPEWQAWTTYGTSSDNMSFGGAETQSISATFQYNF